MLALLPLATISPHPADSEEERQESASQPVEAAGARSSTPIGQRPAPMMGDLIFDHDEHADEMEIECEECHHETNAGPLDFPHEDYFHDLWIDCDACHREAGTADLEPQSCYECHETKLRGIADERLSRKVTLHQNCWECHEVETGAEASESCEQCHAGMQDEF
jgi:hypothetical protein